jgi:IclR family acetate operon transcriptional repressor
MCWNGFGVNCGKYDRTAPRVAPLVVTLDEPFHICEQISSALAETSDPANGHTGRGVNEAFGNKAQLNVKSAQRVLDILQFYSTSRRPATLSGLAEALAMPKSSCLAILNTLVSNGYIYQVHSNLGYYPTRRWLDAATIITANDPVILRIGRQLIQLRDETEETVILGRAAGTRIMYIEVVESLRTIRYTAHVGQFKPLHGTASGKALLGSLNEAERRALISQLDLVALTPRTITNAEMLGLDVAAGRARGWYVTVGENEPDTTAVAAPARVAEEIYIVIVAGTTQRLEGRLEEIGRGLQATCRAIEAG